METKGLEGWFPHLELKAEIMGVLVKFKG